MKNLIPYSLGVALIGSWAAYKFLAPAPVSMASSKTLQADRLLDEKKYAAAAKLYRESAMEAPPDASQVDYDRLRALVDRLDENIAVAELEATFETLVELYRLKQQPSNFPDKALALSRQLLKRDEPGGKKLLAQAARMTAIPPRIIVARELMLAGKANSAQEIIREVLADPKSDPKMRFGAAEFLAETGAMPEARKALEALYQDEADASRKQWLAGVRAELAASPAEKLAWLAKTDTKQPLVQGWMALLEAQELQTKGQTAEARKFADEALVAFSQVPQPHQFQGQIRTHALLYQLDRTPAELDKTIAALESALEILPRDQGLLLTLAEMQLEKATLDQLAGRLNLAFLQLSASPDLLGYFQQDQAGWDKTLSQLRANPAVGRARHCYGRMKLLAPGDPRPLTALANLALLLHDTKDLQEVVQTAGQMQLPMEAPRTIRERFLAAWTDAEKSDFHATLKRLERIILESKKQTVANNVAALGQWLGSAIQAEIRTSEVRADLIVERAEEADQLASSMRTRNLLISALLLRAHRTLLSDASYAEYSQGRFPFVGSRFLIAAAMLEPQLADVCGRNADVVRARKLVVKRAASFPDEETEWAWAFLQGDPNLVEASKADPIAGPHRQAAAILQPWNVSEILRSVWYWRMRGDDAQSLRVQGRLNDLGWGVP